MQRWESTDKETRICLFFCCWRSFVMTSIPDMTDSLLFLCTPVGILLEVQRNQTHLSPDTNVVHRRRKEYNCYTRSIEYNGLVCPRLSWIPIVHSCVLNVEREHDVKRTKARGVPSLLSLSLSLSLSLKDWQERRTLLLPLLLTLSTLFPSDMSSTLSLSLSLFEWNGLSHWTERKDYQET
jgi:hypothetical protein